MYPGLFFVHSSKYKYLYKNNTTFTYYWYKMDRSLYLALEFMFINWNNEAGVLASLIYMFETFVLSYF